MPTIRYTVNSSAYTDLGATPCTLFLEGTNNPVLLVVQSGAPANTANAVTLSSFQLGTLQVPYTGQNVWGKSLKPGNSFITVIT